jgi:hypothetical protein
LASGPFLEQVAVSGRGDAVDAISARIEPIASMGTAALAFDTHCHQVLQ